MSPEQTRNSGWRRKVWQRLAAMSAIFCMVVGLIAANAARSAAAAGANQAGAGFDGIGFEDEDADQARGKRDEDRRDRETLIAEGREIFRFDTFGDEQNWTDRLRMHEVIEAAVDPATALSLGLKVDVDALPDELLAALAAGQVDPTDPATTVALIKLNAVVGVVGTVAPVDGIDRLTRVGVTCALCHSTVDDSFAPGIGTRLDGWPNLDLDPGAIIAASRAVPPEAKAVYASWGPGMYDPRFNQDAQSTPVVIPPAYGLAGVKRATYTGDGTVGYWNRYVAVTQMGGQGSFHDGRIGVHTVQHPDLVRPKIKALVAYQLSLAAPAPAAGSFDAVAAERGRALFRGGAGCAKCHSGPHFTDINRNVRHRPEETGMDPAYALRSATKKYRTTPLRGLAAHAPYFHDGSAGTLSDVVEHYDAHLRLGLTAEQKQDLVEYLKSL